MAQALFRLGLILLLGVVASYAYNRLMINVSQGTMLRLRKQIFERMEKLPLNYFDTHPHGELMSVYTNDVDSLRQMISTAMAQVFSSLITIVATFTSMVVLSIPLTLVSIFIAVVMMITTTKLGKWSRGYFRTQQESLAGVNSFIEEMMTGQKVVKVFCHEQRAVADFETINEQLRSSAFNANKIANVVMPVNGNLGNLGYVLLAVVVEKHAWVDARNSIDGLCLACEWPFWFAGCCYANAKAVPVFGCVREEKIVFAVFVHTVWRPHRVAFRITPRYILL